MYDAEGKRVAKGTILTMSCDPTANGFQITENYVLGPGGEELTTLDGSNTWLRTNVYVGGRLTATYDQAGLHFHLSDPLGTRRVQLSGNLTSGNQTSSGQPQPLGQAELDCQSLPYGDQQSCTPAPNAPPSSDDATPLHFTGKERDAESGNDYFGARYYASTMGRWMSPDWSGAPSGVPYAAFRNPQSLNLYAYVGNDPINGEDADGHISANMTAISVASGAFATAELALDEEDLEFAPAGNVAASSDTTGSSSASGTANAQATNSNIQTTPASAPPPGQQQSLSPAGLKFLEQQETVGGVPNLTPYDASGKKHSGDWTIGYGHKIKPGEDFSKGITADQAAGLLSADVQTAVNAVNGALRYPTGSFQNEFDAMVSLAYNIGGGAFASSTLVTRYNSGGVVEQPDLFTRFSRTGGASSPGLYARREREYTLFNTGVY